MNILLPITITEAMIAAGTTIPAVDAGMGEVAWVAGDYALGARLTYKGWTWQCTKAIAGAPVNAYSPDDPRASQHWEKDETSPTNRMAPFDEYVFTAAKQRGGLKYVLTPPFFNGVAMYGVEADQTDIKVYEPGAAPGAPPIHSHGQTMWEQAFGEWEYLFGNLDKTNKYTGSGYPIRPVSSLEITLSRSDPQAMAELGYLSIGQWQQLLAPLSDKGGTEFGAEVSPKRYGLWKANGDGTYLRQKGRVAKLITASVLINAKDAPRVSRLLEKIIDIPVAVEASDLPQYGHISTVGFVTGTVRAERATYARVNIKVEGNV